MPRRNRVDPLGNLIATPARGTLMGNRGCLHDPEGNVVKPWARKQWVICLLEFKGRHRQIMAPGRYTELFFLDEVTALAAGHRPCGTCQKARYESFKQLWSKAHEESASPGPSAIEAIDARLHAERSASAGSKGSWEAKFGELPDGTMVTLGSETASAWLKWRGRLHRWAPTGYCDAMPLESSMRVRVITPISTVRTLSAGFLPQVHESLVPGEAATGEKAYPETVVPVPRFSPVSPTEAETHSPDPSPSDQPQVRFHRLIDTPAGTELFTYFAAILRVTGMDRGAVFPLKKFLGNFSTHMQAGRIEEVGIGYRLTRIGQEYFADRYRRGSRQHVDEAEVEVMVRMIRSGGKGWEPID